MRGRPATKLSKVPRALSSPGKKQGLRRARDKMRMDFTVTK
jgi:hypothetical protein